MDSALQVDEDEDEFHLGVANVPDSQHRQVFALEHFVGDGRDHRLDAALHGVLTNELACTFGVEHDATVGVLKRHDVPRDDLAILLGFQLSFDFFEGRPDFIVK